MINTIIITSPGEIVIENENALKITSPGESKLKIIGNKLYIEMESNIGFNNVFNNVSFSSINNVTMINGVIMNGNMNSVKHDFKESERTVHTFNNYHIEKIKISGSAQVNVLCPLSLKKIKLNGSGHVMIKHDYDHLNVGLNGSGCIQLNKIKNASIHLNGSGSVERFHIIDNGNLSLNGSGCIKGIASINANINKNKNGSGSIIINKC